MMNGTRKLLTFLFLTIFFTAFLSVTASADTGPKRSVRVSFQNTGDELCYATLLSQEPSTGPHSVWDGNEDNIQYDRIESAGISLDVWRAFTYYNDSDGFYFLQFTVWQVNEEKELNWGYYPPQKFKVLLYYPETERFFVSNICERYAFDTYYTVEVNDDGLNAFKSYRWQQEVVSLVARIILTIAIEMAVAFIFGFRGKGALLLLVTANTATQIILNVLLNAINYNSGPHSFVANYIMLEIAVFVIEAVVYSVAMKRIGGIVKPTRFYVVYALIANVVSFATGLLIANILPGIF